MSLEEISQQAIKKIGFKTQAEINLWVDMKIPIPTCINKQAEAKWKRERVKENVQAAMRQTKVTGPSLTK